MISDNAKDGHFTYGGLKQGEIRLLRLQPGEFGSPLVGSLESAPLYPRNPEIVSGLAGQAVFEAISYVWGDSALQCEVYLRVQDGLQSKRITRSLYNTLQEIRFTDRVRVVWADGICINQDDAAERSAQVSMMGQIYRHSSAVLVCLFNQNQELFSERFGRCVCAALNNAYDILGHPGWQPADIVYAKMAEALEKDPRCSCCGLDIDQDLVLVSSDPPTIGPLVLHSHIMQLLRSSWHSRTWVIQEVALAQQATIQIGRHHAPWSAFSNLMLRGLPDSVNLAIDCGNIGYRSWEFVSNEFHHIDRYRRYYEKGQFKMQDMIQSLIRFFGRDCGEPKDRIYALRALHGLESANALIPDYSRSVHEIYREFLLYCFENRGTGELQNCSLALLLALTSTGKELPENWPSWIPHFHHLSNRSITKWMDYRFDAIYDWQMTLPEPHSFQHQWIAGQPDQLKVRGRVFSSIVAIKSGAKLPQMYQRRTLSLPYADATESVRQDWQHRVRELAAWARECREWLHDQLGNEMTLPDSVFGDIMCCGDINSSDRRSTFPLKEFSDILYHDYAPEQLWPIFGDLPGTSDHGMLWSALQPHLTQETHPSFDYGRKLCANDSGKFGWAPPDAQSGDIICYVLGAPYPFVLRPDIEGCHRLVGDAWLHALKREDVLPTNDYQFEWIRLI